MSNNNGSPDAKKPCKGILKSSSSFDKHASNASHRKSAKFDELNVLQTYHPPDKDYGHMKVDEPKTPFNYAEEDDVDHLDAELLAEKLKVAAETRSESANEDNTDSEDEEDESLLTEEEKQRKRDFLRRRKAHYNEFEAIKLARQLIEEDDEDDENEDTNKKISCEMDVEEAGPSSNKTNSSSKDSANGDNDDKEASQTVEESNDKKPTSFAATIILIVIIIVILSAFIGFYLSIL